MLGENLKNQNGELVLRHNNDYDSELTDFEEEEEGDEEENDGDDERERDAHCAELDGEPSRAEHKRKSISENAAHNNNNNNNNNNSNRVACAAALGGVESEVDVEASISSSGGHYKSKTTATTTTTTTIAKRQQQSASNGNDFHRSMRLKELRLHIKESKDCNNVTRALHDAIRAMICTGGVHNPNGLFNAMCKR